MVLKIRQAIYDTIIDQVGNRETEDGGICGANNEHEVSAFVYDSGLATCPGKYTPNVQYLNKVIKEWQTAGTRFCAFVHSHPMRTSCLSLPDIQYAKRVLQCFDYLEQLYLLLVVPCDNQTKQIICYCVNKSSNNPNSVVLQMA